LGSGEVAREYASEGKKVKGLFHMYVLLPPLAGSLPNIRLTMLYLNRTGMLWPMSNLERNLKLG